MSNHESKITKSDPWEWDNFPVYRWKSSKYSYEEILSKKLFHVFVFGLPRSGTSMTTKICELLGIKMLYTSEDKPQDYSQFGDYHPNRTGFYEITNNPIKNFFDLINTPYSGCKMIVPVQGFRWELVRTIPSKVIMTWRDPEEIRQSQNAFYAKNADSNTIHMLLMEQENRLLRSGLDFMVVKYRDIIKNTAVEIQKIKEFIHSDYSIEQAVQFVNPEAYRFDQDKITEGL